MRGMAMNILWKVGGQELGHTEGPDAVIAEDLK